MAKEQQNNAENEEAPGGKKSKKMLLVIIAAVVLLGGGVGGFFGYKALSAEEDGDTEQTVEKDNPPQEAYGVEIMIPEKPQTFNLKDPRRYISLQLLIVVPEENIEVQENIKKREAQIMDTLINILNEKSVAELKSREGMDDLKNQIRNRVTTFINEDDIQEVLITKYLIQ